MGVFLIYLCTIITILFNLKYKKSKENEDVQKIFFISSAVILFIAIGNTWNADYSGYANFYANSLTVVDNGLEMGFQLLMKIFSISNISYFGFLSIIFCFIMYVSIYLIKKYCSDQESIVALLLFAIYPIFLNIIQIRFFLAATIVLFAIDQLISERKKIFYILVLVATTLHTTALLSLLTPVLLLKNKNTILKYSTIITVIFSLFMFTPLFEIIITSIIGIEKYNAYFVATKMGLGFFVFLGLLNIFPIIIFNKYRKYIKIDDLSEIIEKINYVILIFSPLYYFSNSFERIPRMFILFNFIIYAKIYGNIKNNKERSIYILVIFVHILLSFIFFELPYVFPIFQNNIFFV
ncbi:MAG: EpsG family protein [Culicoidibacterales bacterium]